MLTNRMLPLDWTHPDAKAISNDFHNAYPAHLVYRTNASKMQPSIVFIASFILPTPSVSRILEDTLRGPFYLGMLS